MVILILLSVLISLSMSSAKVDPATMKIRIICIGESYVPETRLPILLKADPRIAYQAIPANWAESTFQVIGGASRKDALKFIRQYMPRSYGLFVENYDIILLSDFEVDVITEQQFMWMERGVREGGMGLGKYEMNYDPGHFSTFDRFRASAVYKAVPADLKSGSLMRRPLEGIYAVKMPDTGEPHPMLDLPEMRRYRLLGSGDYGYETPRTGATVVARFKPNDQDAMIIWDYGDGRSLTCVPGLDKISGAAITDWPFVVDFWINQMWYLADLAIPDDIQMVHTLRSDSLTYVNERSLATSVIQFVEKFGASTDKLYGTLDEVDEIKAESDMLYMEGRYEDSLQKLEEAYAALGDLSRQSVEVKERALFWIYTIEWLAVSGTAILTGVIVWSLMVRRRLYHEVEITKAEES